MKKKDTQQSRIYLDNAATTPVDPRVLEAMLPYFSEDFGNPGSIHKEGVAAKMAVYRARKGIADFLSALPDEVLFTSSGTEANNLAIFGFAGLPVFRGYALCDLHFITSAIEHPSVLDCFRELARRGARVSFVPVTREGIIDMTAFEKALTPKTVFISVMLANNEIGVIQPISEIAKLLARKRKAGFFQILDSRYQIPFFHTDASQAPLYVPLNVRNLGVEMLTLDAQKVYGPKGIGLLYRARNVNLSPILYGGSQERGLRPGTENVPGIVGFAEALAIAGETRENESARLSALRDDCIKRILEVAPTAEINGSREKRLPNSINISFPGYDSEWLVLALDAKGIAVSARSACMSEKEPGSPVVLTLGKGEEYATSSIRITLGRWTTKEDIDALIAALKRILTPTCSRCGMLMPDAPTIYAHQDGSACHDVRNGEIPAH